MSRGVVADFETGILALRPGRSRGAPGRPRAGWRRVHRRGSGRREVTEMSDDDKRRPDAAAKRAANLFERQQQSERRVTDEEKRHIDMLAKPTRLREQRLARDAAEEKTAKSEANPKRPGSGVS